MAPCARPLCSQGAHCAAPRAFPGQRHSRVASRHHGALLLGHDGEQLASDVDDLPPHKRPASTHQRRHAGTAPVGVAPRGTGWRRSNALAGGTGPHARSPLLSPALLSRFSCPSTRARPVRPGRAEAQARGRSRPRHRIHTTAATRFCGHAPHAASPALGCPPSSQPYVQHSVDVE